MRNQEFHEGVDGLKSLGTPDLKQNLHNLINLQKSVNTNDGAVDLFLSSFSTKAIVKIV